MNKTYTCECCDFSTINKTKFNRHTNTQKHNANMSLNTQNITPKKVYECNYCNKNFKHPSSMYRHMKHVCKQKQDDMKDSNEFVSLLDDMKYLKKLLSILDEKQTMNNQMIIKILKRQDEQIEDLKEKFNKLTNYLQFPMEECKIE